MDAEYQMKYILIYSDERSEPPVMERRCFENPARAIGKLSIPRCGTHHTCTDGGRCEVNVFLNKVKFNLAFERNTCQYSSTLVLLRVGRHIVMFHLRYGKYPFNGTVHIRALI